MHWNASMASTTLSTPGSSSWGKRFRVSTSKTNPLRLTIVDTELGLTCYHLFSDPDAIEHFVQRLRVGSTERVPDGLIASVAPA